MKGSKVQPAAAGLVAALCVVGLGLSAAGPAHASSPTATLRSKARPKPSGADLVAYTSCAQLLDQVKAEAMKEVGPYGLPGTSGGYFGLAPGGVVRGAVPVPTALGAAPTAATPPSTAAASGGANGSTGQPGYSTTNDQEAGVDEPDTVKTDGQVMVILRQQPLGVQVVDVSGSAPKLEGFLALPQLEQASGLFLAGQDVYVIGGQTGAPVPVNYVGGTASGARRPPGVADDGRPPCPDDLGPDDLPAGPALGRRTFVDRGRRR